MQNPDKSFRTQTVRPGQTHALRHSVLRPHQPLGEMVYPGDDLGSTIHLAAYASHGVSPVPIGIVTMSVERFPVDPCEGDYRLRGMAVDPGYRGRGVGMALLRAGLDAAREAGGQRVWCNARMSAIGFYERMGMIRIGPPFEIEGVGTHERMVVSL